MLEGWCYLSRAARRAAAQRGKSSVKEAGAILLRVSVHTACPMVKSNKGLHQLHMGGITKESHSSRLQVRATWARKEFQPTEMLAQGRGIVEQKGIQPALL